MAQDQDNRSKNQPSHDAQVKGGQHSGGQHSQDKTTSGGQQEQKGDNRGQQSGQNPPSHESSVKGGHDSYSGKKS